LTAAIDNGKHWQLEAKQHNNQIKQWKNGNNNGSDEDDSKGMGESEGDGGYHFFVTEITVVWQH
jgi:hypothetical protein